MGYREFSHTRSLAPSHHNIKHDMFITSSQQIIKRMRFLSKFHKVGKLALRTHHGVSPSSNGLCLVVWALQKPWSAADQLGGEILVMIFEGVRPLYSELSPRADEAFCFRTGRISKSPKLTAASQASYAENQYSFPSSLRLVSRTWNGVSTSFVYSNISGT